MDGMCEVLLVEDDTAVAQLVAVMLRRSEQLRLTASVSSAEAGLAYLVGHSVDVVILDDRLDGPTRGIDVVPMIRDLAPRARVLLFSATATPEETQGADAAVSKLQPGQLLPALERMASHRRI